VGPDPDSGISWCGLCRRPNPRLFDVPDDVWLHCVGPEHYHQVVCIRCWHRLTDAIDGSTYQAKHGGPLALWSDQWHERHGIAADVPCPMKAATLRRFTILGFQMAHMIRADAPPSPGQPLPDPDTGETMVESFFGRCRQYGTSLTCTAEPVEFVDGTRLPRGGSAKAKSEGKYKGRSASIDAAEIRRLIATMGPAAIARQLGAARSTVYRLLEQAA
jgi:hypothetical protein